MTSVSDATVPLSDGQQGIWIQDRLGNGAAYNIPLAISFSNVVDVERLATAVDLTLRRHDVFWLRTEEVNGTPIGLPLSRPEGSVVSLVTLGEQETGAALSEQWHTPFDLDTGPLVRAAVYILTDRCVLSLTFHHLVFDDWSLGLLLDEIASAYHGDPTQSVGAVDVAFGLDADADAAAADVAHWERRLGGRAHGLEFPHRVSRREAGRAAGRRGAAVEQVLPDQLVTGLRDLADSVGGTRSTVVLALWGAFVAQYAASHEVRVGTPVADRADAASFELVGYHLKTLVLPLEFSDAASVHETIESVRDVFFDALDRSSASYEAVARRLAPMRDDPMSPLFDVWFAADESLDNGLVLDGVEGRRIEVPTRTAKYDLALFVSFGESTARLTIEYDTDCMDQMTAQSLLRSFRVVLDRAVAEPDGPLGELPVLNTDDEALVTGWERGEDNARAPEPQHLIDAFDLAVVRFGDDTAISTDATTTTYSELWSRSVDIAEGLAAHGIGPGQSVGLAVGRSVDMVASVLAVLRLGAAYVALDSVYPTARLRHMTVQSDVRLVIVDAESDELPERIGVRGVGVVDLQRSAGGAARNGRVPGTPSDVAYITFTSGSTGVPKGIRMSHRAVWNLIGWQLSVDPWIGRGTRTLQFAALGFDVSAQEIFGTLLSGGELVVIEQADRDAVHSIMRLVRDRGVERVFMAAPALLEAVEGAVALSVSPSALKLVISGSEQLVVSAALRAFAEGIPGVRLYNEYGPSETHVATRYVAPSDPAAWPTWMPIGHPIGGSRVSVLDARGRRVPPGTIGELHIDGPGLADGYANQSVETATVFVPSPHGDRGARSYRTGDLARYLADGAIEFLGRRDGQVKIRGFRIELAEIRTALDRLPFVATSFIRAEGSGIDRRLVAWVMPTEAAPDDVPGTVRARLGAELPAYMVPATVIVVEAMPLTPNGKVDARALPAAGHRAPVSDPVEVDDCADQVLSLIASTMGEVLGRPALAATEDFFGAGAHSLSANRLVWMLASRGLAGVTLRSVFESRTPAGIRAGLGERSPGADQTQRPPKPTMDTARAKRRIETLIEEMETDHG